MPLLLIVLALAVVAAAAAFASSRSGRMPDAPPDREPADLPVERWVSGRDLDRTRFALGVRGYRMDQVDALLDRVSTDLTQRDAHLDALTAALVAAGVDVPPVPVPHQKAGDAQAEAVAEVGEEAEAVAEVAREAEAVAEVAGEAEAEAEVAGEAEAVDDGPTHDTAERDTATGVSDATAERHG